MDLLPPGTLWEQVMRRTEAALTSGALLPVPTDHAFIEDQGVRFFVRVLAGLRRKAEARKDQDAAARAGRNANPFLPPEKDLTVGGITDTHLAVLNKFNVVEHHLLIITRRFEDQETLLTPADLEALWTCMAEYDSLGFYNGGAAGGASQRHKHLQLVPLPLSPEGPAVPVEPLLAGAAVDRDGRGTVPAFPFRNAFVRLPDGLWRSPRDAARRTWTEYGRMLQQVGMTPPSPSGLTPQSLPYCFLVTREWMLLVPRSREHFEDISFNSLSFAGSLFVWNGILLDRIREFGPLNALREVSLPR
jgi:ATP adenylyltransferase